MRQIVCVVSVLAFAACSHEGLPNSTPSGDLGQVPTASADLALPSSTSCTSPALPAVHGACDAGPETLCFVPDPTALVPTLDECHCESDHQWWCAPTTCQKFGAPACPDAPPETNVACTRDYSCQFCCQGGTATTQCTCATGHLPSCKIIASCGG